MALSTPTKPLAALAALKALQEDAKRKGLDRTSMNDINSEIAAYRREKRAGASRPSKTPKSR